MYFMNQNLQHSVMDSPVGKFYLSCTEKGLSMVKYSKPAGFKAGSKDGPFMKEAKRQLSEYFAGSRKSWDLPLDFGGSNGFYLKVLKECAKVGYGKTISYQELATKAKSPKAARAVGTAMATNPISIIVPCHRVVKSDGKTGRYGGGDKTKEWLLQMESANS